MAVVVSQRSAIADVGRGRGVPRHPPRQRGASIRPRQRYRTPTAGAEPVEDKRQFTTKQIVAAIIGVLVLIAILENTREGHLTFLFFDFTAPVWIRIVVVYGAALATGLLVVVIGQGTRPPQADHGGGVAPSPDSRRSTPPRPVPTTPSASSRSAVPRFRFLGGRSSRLPPPRPDRSRPRPCTPGAESGPPDTVRPPPTLWMRSSGAPTNC
jgi:uncharacterized integral membrane protein